ncbi:uncharacterized protein K460DRAFT_359426 [Cucurbitaria berberidis CBS 394.84]|uniref:Uncharacterized protein n=1 Tax=Cucurbitaria berberidis CBS 394.84 TaxID=1168544 RepID=A0A9P4L3F6_9PLEO|nr:uncharacterized protein K460DRAFT_359426 [Cucurbitaria berberidis CBS 394.84]KAF1840876.1 hypothetical protein K460DRAFT_359426 [Cucurbitaria berberidis CBS 394.84]
MPGSPWGPKGCVRVLSLSLSLALLLGKLGLPASGRAPHAVALGGRCWWWWAKPRDSLLEQQQWPGSHEIVAVVQPSRPLAVPRRVVVHAQLHRGLAHRDSSERG